jgi:hypothetical protein
LTITKSAPNTDVLVPIEDASVFKAESTFEKSYVGVVGGVGVGVAFVLLPHPPVPKRQPTNSRKPIGYRIACITLIMKIETAF